MNPDFPEWDVFYFLENGTIFTVNVTKKVLLTVDDYCLAEILDENGTRSIIAVCFPPTKTNSILYPIATLLSTPFLLGTFVVYALLPELSNLPGSVLKAYVFMLLVAYVAVATVQLGDEKVLNSLPLCVSLGKVLTC